MVMESRLQRMQLIGAGSNAFHRRNGVTVRLHGEHEAGTH